MVTTADGTIRQIDTQDVNTDHSLSFSIEHTGPMDLKTAGRRMQILFQRSSAMSFWQMYIPVWIRGIVIHHQLNPDHAEQCPQVPLPVLPELEGLNTIDADAKFCI